jgi:hypothetical protein
VETRSIFRYAQPAVLRNTATKPSGSLGLVIHLETRSIFGCAQPAVLNHAIPKLLGSLGLVTHLKGTPEVSRTHGNAKEQTSQQNSRSRAHLERNARSSGRAGWLNFRALSLQLYACESAYVSFWTIAKNEEGTCESKRPSEVDSAARRARHFSEFCLMHSHTLVKRTRLTVQKKIIFQRSFPVPCSSSQVRRVGSFRPTRVGSTVGDFTRCSKQ